MEEKNNDDEIETWSLEEIEETEWDYAYIPDAIKIAKSKIDISKLSIRQFNNKLKTEITSQLLKYKVELENEIGASEEALKEIKKVLPSLK